jgi:ketosteroid isomerase-like protein
VYHRIVKQRVRSLFREANAGNWQAIVDSLAPTFTYRFVGDSPLGGTRTTRTAMQLWFERLYRLFPGATFTPERIVVDGPPWRTTIMTYVRINSTAPDSAGARRPYENEFMQRMTLRWGSIDSVVTLEDTQRFVNALPHIAATGLPDATAAPIDDATSTTEAV